MSWTSRWRSTPSMMPGRYRCGGSCSRTTNYGEAPCGWANENSAVSYAATGNWREAAWAAAGSLAGFSEGLPEQAQGTWQGHVRPHRGRTFAVKRFGTTFGLI